VSANHEGYEQAMKDVLLILDAAAAIGGDVGGIRIAVESLRRTNIRCAAEREVGNQPARAR